jgi:hypothetical protein
VLLLFLPPDSIERFVEVIGGAVVPLIVAVVFEEAGMGEQFSGLFVPWSTSCFELPRRGGTLLTRVRTFDTTIRKSGVRPDVSNWERKHPMMTLEPLASLNRCRALLNH